MQQANEHQCGHGQNLKQRVSSHWLMVCKDTRSRQTSSNPLTNLKAQRAICLSKPNRNR